MRRFPPPPRRPSREGYARRVTQEHRSKAGFDTRAIHAGYEPDEMTGADNPPIYASSTYKQDGVGGLRGGYEYSRSANPTRTALEVALAAVEDGDRGFACAEPIRQRGERAAEPLPAFEQDQRRAQPGEFRDRLVARLRFGGEEPGEQEPVARQARQHQREDRRSGTGNAVHRHPRRASIAHQPVAGVGDKRRARIAHQHHRLARHARDQRRARGIVAVVVVADQRALDADQVEEFASDARILARDEVGRSQRRPRTIAEVAEVADRRRYDVEAGG